MCPEFLTVGISLEKFYIENVSMPEELIKEIFEYSRLDTIDLDKLTKFKTAKTIEAAAINEGGTAGGRQSTSTQRRSSFLSQPLKTIARKMISSFFILFNFFIDIRIKHL